MTRKAGSKDASSIAHIYNYYVHNSVATFDEEPRAEAYFRERINEVNKTHIWLVWLDESDTVRGYAYGVQLKARFAYRFAAEVSVYVEHGYFGKGIAKSLYIELFTQLAKKGCKRVIGGVALPNDASIALHENLGFKKVAHFERVGFKFDQWIDVAYWQRDI